MTAETFTAVVRPASTYSLDKYERSNASLTSDAVTALAALTTSSTVAEVLDILSGVTRDDYVVGPNQMGLASSTLN